MRHGLTEPRALSWELGFHLACGKPTYQVLTGAESRTTEVAEPNWMENLLKEFGDTTIGDHIFLHWTPVLGFAEMKLK